jgi:hypothetical protein
MESSDVAEIKRHFSVVAEGLEKKIQLVAEGVSALDERVMSLEEKMDRGFDEVKAMIKFSYAELDRRVASLEAGLAKLEVRVLKVEAR